MHPAPTDDKPFLTSRDLTEWWTRTMALSTTDDEWPFSALWSLMWDNEALGLLEKLHAQSYLFQCTQSGSGSVIFTTPLAFSNNDSIITPSTRSEYMLRRCLES